MREKALGLSLYYKRKQIAAADTRRGCYAERARTRRTQPQPHGNRPQITTPDDGVPKPVGDWVQVRHTPL